MIPECVRERDVTDAIVSGRWPDRCDEDLREHIAGCSICKDVAVVARALHNDYASAWFEARVPAPGLVWWRTEMRARQDAVQIAAKPIKIFQAVAGACIAGVSLALLSRVDVTVLSSLLLERAIPLSVVLGLVILAPLALYFVFSDE